MSQAYTRFVPQGTASRLEDAPGWGPMEKDEGPICWKCKGTRRQKNNNSKCGVCQGQGRLPPKRQQVTGANSQTGVITRERQRSRDWSPSGPRPYALALENTDTRWIDLVAKAKDGDVEMSEKTSQNDIPVWLPRQGEQLCNLVGSWRILQRVSSHRWTTDDLVTAWVASQQQQAIGEHHVDYLDLGTGNASVLQMVTWALLKNGQTVKKAIGVEARSEAVELARRSLSFNVGSRVDVHIVHGDFRDVISTQEYDLVTGTPPYFRVDFTINDEDKVTEAVIQQGGMPTARQSAPARCEFRGGIEAYCEAAARVLKPSTGRFVVCENWLNHDRAVAAATETGLQILKQVEVIGREGKPTLFCVYVMKKADGSNVVVQRESLVVRERNGNWTESYRKSILASMSIPYPTA